MLSQQPRCYLKKANITLRLLSSNVKQNDGLKISVLLEGQLCSNRTTAQRLTGPMEGLTGYFTGKYYNGKTAGKELKYMRTPEKKREG